MSAWKKNMADTDLWLKGLLEREHQEYPEDPYVLVYPDKEHAGIWHLCFNVDQGCYTAWMHLVEGEEKALLIDTGYGIGNLKGLVQKLTDKPLLVANTHFHGDHSAGNGQFEEVYCHEYDVPYLKAQMEKTEGRLLPPGDFYREEDIVSGASYQVRGLKDGEFLDLGDGDRIEIVHMPGHTAGGCMFLDHRTRLLFSGDAVLATPTLIIDRFPNPFYPEYMTVSAFRDGLERFAPRLDEVEAVYPGHGIQGIDRTYFQDMLACTTAIMENPDEFEVYDYVDDPGQRQIKCVGKAMVVYSGERVWHGEA